LQAIASALGIIEGDLVAAQLMKLYRARLDRTLIARGLLRKNSERGVPSSVNLKIS
jgi:hypothetical protein